MARLNVPSLQHLARNWREDSGRIRRLLVALANDPPTFSYDPLFGAVRDMLVFGQPYEQIEEGIRRGVKRKDVRENLLGVLPLIRDHFSGISPDFVQSIERRYYPVGRGLMIPFEPPMIYGCGGRLYFPWFSFWRRNPLFAERLSLFVTLVDELLLQDPDLEDAQFEILDFSAPSSESKRELRVIAAREVPRLDEARKVAMLENFAEGYFMAVADLAASRRRPDGGEPRSERDPNQSELFD